MLAEVAQPQKKDGIASFIGLNAYSEDQAKMFFGRDEEIKTLYKLIKNHTLTIVFGKSGTGKTSLLNAGVFPKLREDYCLPFRIRLEFNEDSPGLIAQIKKVLQVEIDKYGFRVENYPAEEETLWEYFHKESLWEMVTPILIFDQFEEIFTLAGKSTRFKKEELDLFLEEISDVIENSIPEKLKQKIVDDTEKPDYNYHRQKCKVIFSFREDFLPEIESITSTIPSVKNSRFRLKAMDGQQAFEVITKTWKNSIDPGEARKIVYFLTNEAETDNAETESKYGKYGSIVVEPSLLSQVCAYLDKQKQDEGLQKISATFLAKYPKGVLLRSLYQQVLDDSNKTITNANNKNDYNKVQLFIEDNLITDEGYRTKFSVYEIQPDIKPGIEVLKGKYFLREEGKTIELTHDVIVTLVKSDREERRKKAALLLAKTRARKRSRLIIMAASIVGLVVCSFTVYAWVKRNNLIEQQSQLKSDITAKDSILNVKLDSLADVTKSLEAGKKKLIEEEKIVVVDTNYNSVIADKETIITELKNELTDVNSRYNEIKNKTAELTEEIQKQREEYGNREKKYMSETEKKSVEISKLSKDKKDIELAMRKKEQEYTSHLGVTQIEIQRLQFRSDSLQNLLDRYRPKMPARRPGVKIFGYGFDYPLVTDKSAGAKKN